MAGPGDGGRRAMIAGRFRRNRGRPIDSPDDHLLSPNIEKYIRFPGAVYNHAGKYRTLTKYDQSLAVFRVWKGVRVMADGDRL